MKEETKQSLQIVLGFLKQTMKDQGVIIGAIIDKKNADNTKIVFLDKEQFENGKKDGFTVEFDELNL